VCSSDLGRRAVAEVQLDRPVIAGDVRRPSAVLGEGERDAGDLTRNLADDLTELFDPKAADVLSTGGGVLIATPASVHKLAAHPGDATFIEAADGELDAEPGADPSLIDQQVTHAVREGVPGLLRGDRGVAAYPVDLSLQEAADGALDAELGIGPSLIDQQVTHAVREGVHGLLRADQKEAASGSVLLLDGVAAQRAEHITPVGRPGSARAGDEQPDETALVDLASAEALTLQIARLYECAEVFTVLSVRAAQTVERGLTGLRRVLGSPRRCAAVRLLIVHVNPRG